MIRSLETVLLALVVACGSTAPVISQAPEGRTLRLLFAGNSLTYTNQLPGLVQQLATAAGKPTPVVLDRSAPNFGLEDHWTQGTVQRDLRDGQYDILIMQQGPSTLAASGVDLTRWVGILAAEAAKFRTRPAVFATWAPVGAAFQDGVMHYRAAADAARTAFYPASEAWVEAWKLSPGIALYGADNFHPSPAGSLLAAMVITATIYELDPGTLPNPLPTQITPSEMATLREAARIAITRSGRR